MLEIFNQDRKNSPLHHVQSCFNPDPDFFFLYFIFFSPAKTKHYQHLVKVHNTKAAARSSAQVLGGADSSGPSEVQRAVEVHRHSLGKELVVFAGCVSQDELLVSPGAVAHRRSDGKDGFARVLLQFAPCSEGLYLFVGQCQVTRDQFSMEQDECPEEKLHPKPATAPGKGMFELWACSRSLTKRREKKIHKKKQPRAVLSQFSLLETPSFPRVKFTCSF